MAIRLVSTMQMILRKRLGNFSIATGAAFLCAALAVLSSVLFKGASYLFVWPALLAISSLVLDAFKRTHFNSPAILIAQGVLTIPMLLIMAPLVVVSFDAFGNLPSPDASLIEDR
jgi:hypothetical protein